MPIQSLDQCVLILVAPFDILPKFRGINKPAETPSELAGGIFEFLFNRTRDFGFSSYDRVVSGKKI